MTRQRAARERAASTTDERGLPGVLRSLTRFITRRDDDVDAVDELPFDLIRSE